ncbi:MAG: iron ABC transporter permease, partial [Candidatus Brockarchaeota archaeon]|nr:iron ABC transporter permease [Candidatus Brockarchaeota archaeon]
MPAVEAEKTSRFRGMGRRVISRLDKLSEEKTVAYSLYLASIVFFLGIILLPSLLGILLKLDTAMNVVSDPELLNRSISAVFSSIIMAGIVSTLDVAAGLPLAWIIARKKYRWLSIVDSLVDFPLIVPTVILGYSTLLLWCEETPFSITGFTGVSPGFITVLLLHFAFSYPVVVRILAGKLMDIEATYEVAARTLGACPFTTARTITIPMLKSGIIASLILSFARSLSETGATIMVAGSFENGPVFIKKSIDAGLVLPMVFVSLVLIVLSILILAGLRLFGFKLRMPFRKSYRIEAALSGEGVTRVRDLSAIIIFLFLVLLPACFMVLARMHLMLSYGLLGEIFTLRGAWSTYWVSVLNSYVIALLTTLINVVFSLPMAVIITRRKLGGLVSRLLEALSTTSIIMPSVALGVSLSLFWGASGISDFILVLLAHLCITYPYMVATMVSVLEDIPVELEEAGRTLGGTPFKVFRSIVLPIAKYSFLSGVILTFTRSVNETGATLAVSKTFKTVSVLLVEWVKSPDMRVEAGAGTMVLMFLSIILLVIFRYIYTKGG